MWTSPQKRRALPLEAIARDALLPRLDGFRMVTPSPLDEQRRQSSVLLFSAPIEDVLVGIQMLAVDDREFLAEYVAMSLFAPTEHPVFQPVGMERDGMKRLFRRRRWVLDGRHDQQVIDSLTTYVVQEGIPILRRRADLRSLADELLSDEHELESDPISSEEAAYALIVVGQDESAIEILESLVAAKGRGWPGEAEVTDDEMRVLKARGRRMLAILRSERSEALHQLRRWRMARLDGLGLDAAA